MVSTPGTTPVRLTVALPLIPVTKELELSVFPLAELTLTSFPETALPAESLRKTVKSILLPRTTELSPLMLTIEPVTATTMLSEMLPTDADTVRFLLVGSPDANSLAVAIPAEFVVPGFPCTPPPEELNTTVSPSIMALLASLTRTVKSTSESLAEPSVGVLASRITLATEDAFGSAPPPGPSGGVKKTSSPPQPDSTRPNPAIKKRVKALCSLPILHHLSCIRVLPVFITQRHATSNVVIVINCAASRSSRV